MQKGRSYIWSKWLVIAILSMVLGCQTPEEQVHDLKENQPSGVALEESPEHYSLPPAGGGNDAPARKIMVEGVGWIPQAPPGTWSKTMTCVATSYFMISRFLMGQTPTSDAYKTFVDWLSKNDPQRRNWRSGNGPSAGLRFDALDKWISSYDKGKILATTRHISVSELMSELEAGRPVVFFGLTQPNNNAPSTHYRSKGAKHAAVVVGVEPGFVYIHDPGRGQASNAKYRKFTWSSFDKVWSSHKRLAVIISAKGKNVCQETCVGHCGDIATCQCPQCPSGQECHANKCVVTTDTTPCAKSCVGRCGNYQGCLCPSCERGYSCKENKCVQDIDVCNSKCTGKCGQMGECNCGFCSAGHKCLSNKCVKDNGSKPCDALCSGRCGEVQGCSCKSCGSGYLCIANQCKKVDPCAGTCKQHCGSFQGCACGNCPSGYQCKGNTCSRNPGPCSGTCSGRCGSYRGCSCGSCPSGYSCSGSQCVKDNVTKARVSSITPTQVTLNKRTTFTIYGKDLPYSTTAWIANCSSITSVRLNSSRTQGTFSCTPQGSTGSQSGLLKDKPNGNTLFSFSIQVSKGTTTPPCSNVSVSSISPKSAMLNQRLNFTIYGKCLPSTTVAWIANCASITSVRLNSSRTQGTFSCTPQGPTGNQSGLIKDKPNGRTLLSFQLYVSSSGGTCSNPSVSSVSPSRATLNRRTTFTLHGKCLPSTTVAWIANCASITKVYLNSSRTQGTFSCTPQGPTGSQRGVIKDKSGGNTLLNFSVQVNR